MSSRLRWYANRLRCMGAAEIAFRIGNAVRIRRLALRNASPAPAPASDVEIQGAAWFAGHVDALPSLCQAADDVLAGRFQVLSLGRAHLGMPPDWLRDPKTGVRAGTPFGLTLDLTDKAKVGDIKFLWEPSRHHDLVPLAQAYHATGRRGYLDACATLLGSWFEQNPHPLGPHWSSSLEAGIRLINWSIAWHLLKAGDAGAELRRHHPELPARWLDSVYWHLHFVGSHLSAHSSANNHLIGELTGLYVGLVTWPRWRSLNRRRADIHSRLQRQALLQNTADGVNREQASSYHQFVLDFLLIAGLCGRANGEDYDAAYWQRLEAMCGFMAALRDAGGHMPQIGDADDGLASGAFLGDADNFTSLLATGAVLFKRADLATAAGSIDAKSLWLLGDTARGTFEALAARGEAPALPVMFREGGYAVLGRDPGRSSEIKVVFDAGPLGYLGIAAHGHADALSVLLSVAGEPMLVDPGTYSYHGPQEWRLHFRSTAAHNTLEVDGRSQSESGGRFMWTSHANARWLQCALDGPSQTASGEHRGYADGAGPLVHRRELRFDAARGELLVTDWLEGGGVHDVCLRWQVASGVQVHAEAGHVQLRGTRASVDVQLPATLEHGTVRAEDGIPAAWLSPSYERLEPGTLLESRGTAIALPARWITRFYCATRPLPE